MNLNFNNTNNSVSDFDSLGTLAKYMNQGGSIHPLDMPMNIMDAFESVAARITEEDQRFYLFDPRIGMSVPYMRNYIINLDKFGFSTMGKIEPLNPSSFAKRKNEYIKWSLGEFAAGLGLLERPESTMHDINVCACRTNAPFPGAKIWVYVLDYLNFCKSIAKNNFKIVVTSIPGNPKVVSVFDLVILKPETISSIPSLAYVIEVDYTHVDSISKIVINLSRVPVWQPCEAHKGFIVFPPLRGSSVIFN